MSRKRRAHSPALKAKAALAAIQGEKTIAELAEQFQIHPNQITKWKKQIEKVFIVQNPVNAAR